MTDEKLQLLLIKGAISDLQPKDREGVEAAAAELRRVVAQYNDHGLLALALVVAELAAKG